MANVSTTHTASSGILHGVYYCNSGASTPTDLTDELILDASALTGSPTKIALESISVACSGNMSLVVEFNDATDSIIFAGGTTGGGGGGTFFWESKGLDLVVSPTISGPTGDVQVTTSGMTVADEGFTLAMIFRGTT